MRTTFGSTVPGRVGEWIPNPIDKSCKVPLNRGRPTGGGAVNPFVLGEGGVVG